MSRTRITIDGTGELLHEGPSAPSALEVEAARERERHIVHVDTPWGPGEYDRRQPLHVTVHGKVKRPVA